ncbi:hybrid sensor histidine kinase/response regulator [Chlorobaculum sp. 24CR]|nr:hybrid sensor histidine kinase/response regulator [Chlorobaculum sp. 24CR]
MYASVIGALGHFSLFFVYNYFFHIQWESLPARLIGVILCIGTLYRLFKPDFLGRYFVWYWHVMLIYVLPFIITLFCLKNDFAEPWLYWELFMVFVLISFVPHWLIFFLDLVIGVSLAILVYLLTTPAATLMPPASVNIPLYSIVLVFSIFAGYLFNQSNLLGLRYEEQQKAAEKTMVLEALAGSIAHEMRNPLSQIRHNLDEILLELPHCRTESDCSTPSIKNLETISNRANQAQIAVNRGLHVITMTLGNFRNTDVSGEELSCLSAMTMARKALEEYGYASEEEQQMIHLMPGEDFLFLGEENNFILVLYNLLVNALQILHAEPDGRIDITLQRGELFNRILIRDNGPGISSENISKIFDPFFTSGKKGGTGLGLAFCRRVMHSFKGQITCESEEGRFTEFTLEFPVLDHATIDRYESSLYAEYTPVLSGKKALLAGIPETYAPLLRRQLTPLNLNLDEAADGSLAFEMIEASRYNLVLADMSLPPSGAEKLAMSIKSNVGDIPVIACSSSRKPPINAIEGIDAVIAMPPALPELLGAMKTSLEMVREALKESIAGKTVLVADDIDSNRRVIKLMLNKLDVTFLEASNGLEVLEILKSQPCDLLIIDMRMPVLDGFETAKRIRSTPSSYRDMPILGLSGNLDNETLKMVKESGIDDSLIKPLKLKPFLQKVSAMLKLSQP